MQKPEIWFSTEVHSPVDAVFEYSDTNWTGSQDRAANGKFDVHI